MLQETAEAILNEPQKIKVVTNKRPWYWPFIKQEVTYVFEIRPLTLGAMIQISKILLKVDLEQVKEHNTFQSLAIHFSNVLGTDLARIIAIAIHNSKKEPPQSLLDLIENNVTTSQMVDLFSMIMKQMNVSNFTTSIILIRGTNLLMKTNPVEQRSQIASGEQSADSSNISDFLGIRSFGKSPLST